MVKILRSLLPAILLLPLSVSAEESPRVVVTIEPLAALVSGVMDGITQPDVLVRQGVSPHVYSLRPSDARRLRQADLVVRVDEHFEIFLNRALSSLSASATVVSVAEIEGITLFPLRNWRDSEHAHDHHHDDEYDLHLWLHTDNAVAIVRHVSLVLGRMDPDNRQRYTENAARLVEQLSGLKQEVSSILQPVQDMGFISWHDALQYFEQQFQLQNRAVINIMPDTPVSAGSAARVRQSIRQGVQCVFTEPQYEQRALKNMLADTKVRIAELDPLGRGDTFSDYLQMMRTMAQTIRQCLSSAQQAPPP